MNPAKDNLFGEVFQVLCITYFGVCNDVFFEYFFAGGDIDTMLAIIIIAVSQHITIPIFNKYFLGVFDILNIIRDECPSFFVFFVRDW